MNAAIILSGGTGTRLGSKIPKQYLKVKGKTILSYCVETLAAIPQIDIIVIVRNPEWQDEIDFVNRITTPILFTHPGETRQLSILNGLCMLESYGNTIDKILIQDAARPLTSSQLIEECLDSCADQYLGVMPVLPMKDTIYQSNSGIEIDSLLNRNILFAGQAPEAFKFRPYLDAHRKMSYDDLLKITGSSELAFLAGMKIKLIAGDPLNFKITDKSDLNRFENIITKI